MKISWDKLNSSSNEQDNLIIKKFIKATYQRCPTNDQSRLIQFYPNNENFYPTKYMTVKDIKNDFADILDNSVYDNIVVDESKFINLKNNINNTENNIILSLSGGVDSMICSSMFISKYNSAVHINYCNRTTSDREEEFVKAWCDYMRIPLYIRRIGEINRPLCMENNLRDIYESYTRNVRYSTYRNVNSFGPQNKNTHKYRPISLNPIKSEIIKNIPRVVLGHNKDDCLENIFTNIAHENHYENLNGMTELSTQDDIEFIRPLLNISKDEIRNFAYKMKYPFLPNSTPSWSQRGQIRSNIVPVLEKWDSRITSSLFSLSNTMKDLHIILNSFVDSYLKKTITTFQNDIYEYYFLLENNNVGIIDIPKINLFWKVYLTKLCNNTPSIKSLNNLTLKLKNWDNISTMKIALKKNMEIRFTKTKCEIVYKP
jgi:tRNA(Ile)-lysidine synthetase-like protein